MRIIKTILFVLFGIGREEKEMIDNGYLSYEGQGRDKYGR
jgi:hypothetical protein